MAFLKSMFGGDDRSSEGVPGRAVVRWGHCGLGPGQKSTKARTKIELVLADGSPAKLVEGLPWKLAVAVCGWNAPDPPDWFDTEIPVRFDPSTGELLGLDRPALEHELADRLAIIDQRWSVRGQVAQEIDNATENITSAMGLPGALHDAAKTIKHDLSQPVDETLIVPESMQIADGDPAMAPIEGVSYEVWVAVQGGMLREKIKSKARFDYASSHGIPDGRWDAISAAWMSRAQSNRGIAVRLAQDLETARRGG